MDKKIKKFLREEVEKLGDKIRFGMVIKDKLFATIIRQNKKEDKVYWLLDLDRRELKSVWYYPIED